MQNIKSIQTSGSSLLFGCGGVGVITSVVVGIAGAVGITLAVFTLAVASIIGLIVLWKVIKLSKILFIARSLKLTVGIDYLRQKYTKNIKISNECRLCQFIAYLILYKHVSYQDAGKIGCQEYFKIGFSLDKTTECVKWAKIYVPHIENVVKSTNIKLTPELLCNLVIQKDTCRTAIPELSWRIDIPAKCTSSSSSSQSSDEGDQFEEMRKRTFNILHLSDVHLSFDYLVGSDDNCGNIVCCKNYLNQRNYKTMAGIWGSFQCDTPKHTFQATLEYISNNHEIDLIYFTGDVVDHAFWNASQSSNSDTIEYFYEALYKAFPNILIMPVLGNHEASPFNCIPPKFSKNDEISQEWLYNLVSKLWSRWLPKSAIQTVRLQGYYTTVVHKRLRIIALNNNICHVFNYCLLKNPYFLEDQLNFLLDTLVTAEKNNEIVHIITHIPPGHGSCVEAWEANYAALISRFKDIIQGQFFGYSHGAELKIFYDVDTGEPINIGFIGGSLTPLPNYHPSFKIYSVDQSTYEILDEELFTMNLTKSNLSGKRKNPIWYSLGSLKTNFDLKNLRPKSVSKMLSKIATDQTLFYKYYTYYTRDSDVLMQLKCDAGCERKVKCYPFTTVSVQGPHIDIKICKGP